PARIAELAGRPPVPIDAVFVAVDGRWHAVVGIAALLRTRIAALDPACAPILDHIDPAGGRCIEAAWAVSDAVLREHAAAFVHACRLATNLCAKPSP
ncbi:MAG: hypothetical protein H0X17_15320, partial [Deltaproteobacteria bacterium]|nr:hypothetical protein [Deltaproteobacteria bacterium]